MPNFASTRYAWSYISTHSCRWCSCRHQRHLGRCRHQQLPRSSCTHQRHLGHHRHQQSPRSSCRHQRHLGRCRHQHSPRKHLGRGRARLERLPAAWARRLLPRVGTTRLRPLLPRQTPPRFTPQGGMRPTSSTSIRHHLPRHRCPIQLARQWTKPTGCGSKSKVAPGLRGQVAPRRRRSFHRFPWIQRLPLRR